MKRRRFLRGSALGAASLALPLLPSLGDAQDGYPTRLVVFFSGNGTIVNNWVPSAEGGRITSLSPILAPLQDHLSKLMVVRGVDIEAAKREYQPKGGFHAHERGLGGILTGRPLNLGPMVEGSGYASGISVDQFIADRLEAESSIRSLHLGLISRRHGGGDFNRNAMSYAGSDQPVHVENDGRRAFEQIFAGPSASAEAFERIRRRRASVLDFVRGDLGRLESRISAEDRLRVAEHHTAFRTLERQLEEPALTCEGPSLSDPGSWTDQNNMDAIADFQVAQLAQALACDRTRVATMMYGTGLGALSLRPIGMDDSWHSLSHDSDSDAGAQGKLTQYNTYIAGIFGRLLTAMDNIVEGDGTLLDHSIVCWVNELGIGNVHDHNNVPIVMAGGGNGFFKTGGAYVELGDRPNNDFLISLCHGMGQDDVTEFGLPELSSGPISQLHV